jgi:autotransporter-associated beta strand protein
MKQSLKRLTMGLLALAASVEAVNADTTTLAATQVASGVSAAPNYSNVNSDNLLQVGNDTSRAMTSQLLFSSTALTGLGNVTVTGATLTLVGGISQRGQAAGLINLYELVPANAGFTAAGKWANKDGSAAWAGGSSGASVSGTDYVNVLIGSAATPAGGLSQGQTLSFALNAAGLAVIQSIVNGTDTNPGFVMVEDYNGSGARNYNAFGDGIHNTGVAAGPSLAVTYTALPSITLAATSVASGVSVAPSYANVNSDNLLEVGNSIDRAMTSQLRFNVAALTGLGNVAVTGATLKLSGGITQRGQAAGLINLYELVPANAGFTAAGSWANKNGAAAWVGGSSGASTVNTDYVNVLLGSAATPAGGLSQGQTLAFTLNSAGLAVIQAMANGSVTNPGFILVEDSYNANSSNFAAFGDGLHNTGVAAGPSLAVTYTIQPVTELTWNAGENSIWDATTANWTGAPWQSGGAAVFGAAGIGTVTIASGGVTANSLTFNNAGYSLGGAPITLNGAATLAANADASISAAITSNLDLTKTGAGTLTLGGVSAYGSNTTVSGGVLDITGQIYNSNGNAAVVTVGSGATLRVYGMNTSGHAESLGTLGGNAANLVLDGGTLEYSGAAQTWGNRRFTVGAGGATLKASQSAQVWYELDNITNNSTLTLDGAATGDIQGVISGSGALVKTGSGSWIIEAVNDYTGATLVNGGTLRLNSATATLGSNSPVTLANVPGALLLSSYWTGSAQVGASFSIGSLSGGGANGGNVALWPCTMTIGTDNTSTTFGGVIYNYGAPASIAKVGTGTLTLTNANTYSGTTTLSGGTLQLGNATVGHNGSLTSASIVNNANLVFNLAGSSSYSGVISGTGTTTVQAGTLTLTGSIASTVTLAINGGAVLHLPNTSVISVAALVINGSSKPNGAYDASNTGGAITGLGVIQVGPTGVTPQYTAWATSFTGFTDTYPTHDPDGDGMTNQQEFAFGLDPTSGASNNPIVVPFDKSTGTFSYTRLTTSGLSYVIYTSPDLKNWAVDGGAKQIVTSNDGDVDTVEVTLSDLPLTAPKLFVRVAAQ